MYVGAVPVYWSCDFSPGGGGGGGGGLGISSVLSVCCNNGITVVAQCMLCVKRALAIPNGAVAEWARCLCSVLKLVGKPETPSSSLGSAYINGGAI